VAILATLAKLLKDRQPTVVTAYGLAVAKTGLEPRPASESSSRYRDSGRDVPPVNSALAPQAACAALDRDRTARRRRLPRSFGPVLLRSRERARDRRIETRQEEAWWRWLSFSRAIAWPPHSCSGNKLRVRQLRHCDALGGDRSRPAASWRALGWRPTRENRCTGLLEAWRRG
jgi:hypothetical protein